MCTFVGCSLVVGQHDSQKHGFQTDECLINLNLRAFKNIKDKSNDGLEIRKLHDYNCLEFYPVGSLSFLATSQIKNIYLQLFAIIWESVVWRKNRKTDFVLVPRFFCLFLICVFVDWKRDMISWERGWLHLIRQTNNC